MPSMGSDTGEPVFDQLTETIGTAANYDRPWRLSTQQLPGHFIRVNNAVPFYGYTVEFPAASRALYKGLARNNDGLIYLPVPPEPVRRSRSGRLVSRPAIPLSSHQTSSMKITWLP